MVNTPTSPNNILATLKVYDPGDPMTILTPPVIRPVKVKVGTGGVSVIMTPVAIPGPLLVKVTV